MIIKKNENSHKKKYVIFFTTNLVKRTQKRSSEMFLYKNKNGKWYIFYDSENGKIKSKSTGRTLKSEAHKYLIELQRNLEAEKKQIVKPIYIKEIAFYYLRQNESHFTYKTININKTTFKYLENHFGNIQLSGIKWKDMQTSRQLKFMHI